MTDQLDRLKSALADHYSVERELGSGGMATVYLARDLKHQRRVALKVLHPQLAATVGAARFVREVSIAANLTHPHILPLHDSGQTGPFLYYVMPYIEGESLRERLGREGKLSVAEATRIMHQVADALSYAHSRGIVHRDIKPENIMLTGRNAVVADFGIAKALSEASDTTQTDGLGSLTTVGIVIGTPAYMAPEQAMGEPGVDHRVDIYSWGAVAYEMLTGNRPFEGRTQQEILSAQITQTPDPITRADVAEASALTEVISKSLEKNAADRWQSVEDFLPRLEWSGKQDLPFLLRAGFGRMVGALAAIVVLVFALWFLATTIAGRRSALSETSTSSIAVLPFSDLSAEGDNEFFSDGLADELINSLSKLSGLQVVGRTSAFWFKDKKEDLRAIGEQLAVGAVVDGSVRRAGERIRVSAQLINVHDGFQLWSDSYDRQLDDIFAVQEDVAQSIAAALHVELSESQGPIVASGTEDAEAYSAFLLGRFHWNKRSARDLVLAASHFGEAIAMDSGFAAAWSGLADTYVLYPPYGVETLSWREAISRSEQAARTAIALDSMSAEAHASLAIVHDARWDWQEADQEFQRAIAINPKYATAHQWYGIFLVGTGRLQDGLAAIRHAEELDPLSPIIGVWVALVLDAVGETAQATAQFEKVVALHPGIEVVQRDAWLHFLRVEDFDQAADHLQRYLDISGSPLATRWPRAVRDEATRMATLREIADSTRNSFKMSTDLNMMLGQQERALSYLESMLSAPDEFKDSAGALRAYVLNEQLRGDPRFQALLSNMGLSWD
jgi:serine/threonine-protein kinase